MKSDQIAAMIDHTLLKADAHREEVIQLCKEADKYKFATVCVNPFWVPLAVQELAECGVGITTVVGFPLGGSRSAVKALEARDAMASGATEIDMVLNIGALKSGDFDEAEHDIREVALACKGKALLKVIIETCYLTRDEKTLAAQMSKSAGADYIKTSTGFGPSGATLADIQLIRKTIGPDMGIKASGGVKSLKFALQLIGAGATRIGTSSGIALLSGSVGSGY